MKPHMKKPHHPPKPDVTQMNDKIDIIGVLKRLPDPDAKTRAEDAVKAKLTSQGLWSSLSEREQRLILLGARLSV